jgi:hypothetical protein
VLNQLNTGATLPFTFTIVKLNLTFSGLHGIISQNLELLSKKAMLASVGYHNIALPIAGIDNCEYKLVKGMYRKAPARG